MVKTLRTYQRPRLFNAEDMEGQATSSTNLVAFRNNPLSNLARTPIKAAYEERITAFYISENASASKL